VQLLGDLLAVLKGQALRADGVHFGQNPLLPKLVRGAGAAISSGSSRSFSIQSVTPR